jgi:endonuclease/exonuclease/phosphatase family metal-dependent hydrolase
VRSFWWGGIVAAGAVVMTLSWVVTYQATRPGVPVAASTQHGQAAAKTNGLNRASAVLEVPKIEAKPTVVNLQAQAAAAKLAREARIAAKKASAPFSFKIATFNVLGSQHTAPGGDATSRAPGYVRSRWAADIINTAGADIIGFDEMQLDQYNVMMQNVGGYESYPGTSLGGAGIPTNIIWRTSKFNLVGTSTLTIDFLGQNRPMPIVELQDKATGRNFYVFNVHNSPVQGKNTHEAERNVQENLEVAKINALRKTGLPVFFMGDLNEHADVFCHVTGSTDLVSASGGSSSGTCRPPADMRVDWIFGSAAFSGFTLDRSAQVQRTTDHTVLFATATVN